MTVFIDDHVHGLVLHDEQYVLATPTLWTDIVVRDAVEQQDPTANCAFLRIDLKMGWWLMEHLVQDNVRVFGIVGPDGSVLLVQTTDIGPIRKTQVFLLQCFQLSTSLYPFVVPTFLVCFFLHLDVHGTYLLFH